MSRLTTLFITLALAGCTAPDAGVVDPPRSTASQSISREFEAEVFAIRPTLKRRASYEIALRPPHSSEAIIVELWDDNPFLSEGLGGVDEFQSLRRWDQQRFVVRVELVTQMSVSRWHLVHWKRVENGE